MAASKDKSDAKGAVMFGIGTAALRKVLVNPLNRHKRGDRALSTVFDSRVFNNALASDPVNEILEGEIIPQLLMAHMSGAAGDEISRLPVNNAGGQNENSDEATPIDSAATQRFIDQSMKLEAPSLLEEVDGFLAQGVSVEAIMLDLLAPAARRLGEMWEADQCDFVDVTMGLWRLQEVMREISLRAPPAIAANNTSRHALFSPIPGDVHSFGAQMIEEVFARAGWQSDVLLQPERRELLDHVSRFPLDVVGLTVSRDCPNSALSNLIKAIRSVAVNPHLTVIIGGSAIARNPEIISEVGADGTGKDAREALGVAERLVAAAPVRANTLT